MKQLSLPLVICGLSIIGFSCQKNVEPLTPEAGSSPAGYFSKKKEGITTLPGSNFSRGFDINNAGMIAGSVRLPDGNVVAFSVKGDKTWFSEENVASNGMPEVRISVNEPGDIAGHKTVPGGLLPVLWKKGVAYDLAPLPGYQYAEVFGINNRGQMVGESLNGNYVAPVSMHATLFSLGAGPVDLGTLGGAKSAAVSINEDGDIVGVSDNATGQSHAFLYTSGIMQDLGTLGGTISNANAINNNDEIVGRSTLANGAIRAFYYKDGLMTDLGTLGGAASVAFDINDSGEIVGFSRVANGEAHAFLYKDGVMTDLGTLGGTDSRAIGINNRGDIIGYYTKTDGTVHGFIYTNGQMYSLQ